MSVYRSPGDIEIVPIKSGYKHICKKPGSISRWWNNVEIGSEWVCECGKEWVWLYWDIYSGKDRSE